MCEENNDGDPLARVCKIPSGAKFVGLVVGGDEGEVGFVPYWSSVEHLVVCYTPGGLKRWIDVSAIGVFCLLGEADAGILFHAPDNVIREFPQFPAVHTFEELKQEFIKASNRALSL